MKKIKTLIVGAGKIGAFFDTPGSEYIITHAKAFARHPHFELVGFVDKDLKSAQKAAKVWGGQAYASIDDALLSRNIDVVSVCVPDNFHYEILKELAEKPIKLVFVEKPITKNIEEASAVIRLYKKRNISLLVNYSRRFLPEVEALSQNIKAGNYGKFLAGTGYYGKGITHNGSHMIDLIRLLVSEIKQVKTIHHEYDFFKDDPSVTAILTMDQDKFLIIHHINCKKYTVFELDLLFEKGRIKFLDSGKIIEDYSLKNSRAFKSYRYLYKKKLTKISVNNQICFAVENILNHLLSGKKLICDGDEGFLNLETALKIKNSSK